MRSVLPCVLAALAAAASAVAAKSEEAVESVVTVQWPQAVATLDMPQGFSPPTPPVPTANDPLTYSFSPQTPGNIVAIVNRNTQPSKTTGFRIDSQRVVTVLPGDKPPADAPRVLDADGDRSASVLAFDAGSRLAVLKIDTPGDAAAALSVADADPSLGEPVRAVYEYRAGVPTVADGTVATPSHYDAALGAFVVRTGVPVAPGTAGAPLLNEAGEVLGVVKGMTSANGQNGPAVAVAAEHVRRLLAYVDGGGTGELTPPRLGAALKSPDPPSGEDAVRPRKAGAVITQVVPGSAAEAAGLKAGERITAIGDAPVRRYEDAIGLIRRRSPGDEVEVVVVDADGESRTVTATLGAAPDPATPVSNAWVEITELTTTSPAEARRLYDWILKDEKLNELLSEEERRLLRERIEARTRQPAPTPTPAGAATPPTRYRAILTPNAEPATPADEEDLRKTIEDLKQQIEELSKRLDGPKK